MSSQLTQHDSLDTESVLLPREPPPWVIRWTAWLLIALLIAIVMRLPETVDCRFVLIPATGADLIHSPRQAIINRVVVEEGQSLPLRVGMKGDAHIIVGGRALIEYAFEPIQQLRESIKQLCRNDRPG